MIRLKHLLLSILLLSITTLTFSCLPLRPQFETSEEHDQVEEQAEGRLVNVEVIDRPDKIRIKLTGSIPISYTAFQTEDPPQLVVDLNRTSLGDYTGDVAISSGGIVSITATEARGDIVISRLAVLMEEKLANNIIIEKNFLYIDMYKPGSGIKNFEIVELIESIETQQEAAADAEKTSDQQPETKKTSQKNADNQIEEVVATEIKGIIVKDAGETVIIQGNGKMNPRVFSLGENRIVIDIPEVANRLDKKLFQVDKQYLEKIRIGQHTNSVRFVFDLPEMVPYEVFTGKDEIVVSLNDTGNKLKKTNPLDKDIDNKSADLKETSNSGTSNKAIPSAEKASIEITSGSESTPVFSSNDISLNLQEADIRSILRLLADVNEENIVISDSVSGNVTLKLDNVPVNHVLEVILEMNHLGMKKRDGIITIDTLSNINKEQDEKARVIATQLRAEELITKVVYVNYTDATAIRDVIAKNLSNRGDISADTRTNSLIIRDTKKNIKIATELIKHLDNKTPQVLIEARIVQVVPEFNKALGIQWGASFSDISNSNITTLSTGNAATFGSAAPGFGINLPAAGVVSPVPSLGFSFGRFTQNPLTLDLRLSAGEFEGLTKIVSTPKITVLDNQEAKIEQGESIPFATTSQQGTKTTFVDANLALIVTPHVTSDKNIILKLKISKNAPGTTRQGAAGPSIEKREAFTTIIMKNAETAVIGGIFETTKTDSKSRVPVLSKIPILGVLFRNSETREKTTELLVFITPTILN